MSFLSTELSIFKGSPYELYEFVNGAETWRYTSDRKPRTGAPGTTYEPRAIRRSSIEDSKEFSRSSITLTVPRDLPVAAQFIQASPEGTLSLTIYRRHVNDPDGELAVYWRGRVASVSFSGSTATMKCDTAYTGLRARGRRATYSTQCRHRLYENGCFLNRADYRVAGAVDVVSGLSVSSDAFSTKPDGWFNGGTATFTVGGKQIRRMVMQHTGGTVTLLGPVPGLQPGDAVEAYAGCGHDLTTCHAKFGNALNFGGFPWKPRKNPFTGDSSF